MPHALVAFIDILVSFGGLVLTALLSGIPSTTWWRNTLVHWNALGALHRRLSGLRHRDEFWLPGSKHRRFGGLVIALPPAFPGG
jgi:hypothetical protein